MYELKYVNRVLEAYHKLLMYSEYLDGKINAVERGVRDSRELIEEAIPILRVAQPFILFERIEVAVDDITEKLRELDPDITLKL